jgi:hypothetical protein
VLNDTWSFHKRLSAPKFKSVEALCCFVAALIFTSGEIAHIVFSMYVANVCMSGMYWVRRPHRTAAQLYRDEEAFVAALKARRLSLVRFDVTLTSLRMAEEIDDQARPQDAEALHNELVCTSGIT